MGQSTPGWRTAPKATLLVFIDDATSEILSLEFVRKKAFRLWRGSANVIFGSWLPMSFYSDRFSVFAPIAQKPGV